MSADGNEPPSNIRNTGKTVEIPFPSEDLSRKLFTIDFDQAYEHKTSKIIDDELTKIFADIENSDMTCLDIIGSQMEKMMQMHEELLNTTKKLFSSLVGLKNIQVEIISAKRQQTIQTLRKIENTIDYISKLD